MILSVRCNEQRKWAGFLSFLTSGDDEKGGGGRRGKFLFEWTMWGGR